MVKLMDRHTFAKEIDSLFPQGTTGIVKDAIEDAVYEAAYADYDIDLHGETDEREVSRHQSRHAQVVIEEGVGEQILYLLNQEHDMADILDFLNILKQDESLTSHQKIELSAFLTESSVD